MGINRKIKRNNKQNVMYSVSQKYNNKFSYSDIEDAHYKVTITKINLNYFTKASDLYDAYELFFEDLIDISERENKKFDVIEFLQDSVDSNYMLSDTLTKQNFQVEDEHIYTIVNDNNMDLINFGEFTIENYKVNTCGSHMFFTDLHTHEQFMYYGD